MCICYLLLLTIHDKEKTIPLQGACKKGYQFTHAQLAIMDHEVLGDQAKSIHGRRARGHVNST